MDLRGSHWLVQAQNGVLMGSTRFKAVVEFLVGA
jgi:hypothetical protein